MMDGRDGSTAQAAAEPWDVAILMVSYRSARDIAICLAALETSTYRRFRVVICENGGAAAFDALQASLPAQLGQGQSVRAWEAPSNLGFAGGTNLCLDQAGAADAYWILNPDTQPEPGALAAMLARLAQGDCGAVGHDLVLPDGVLASRGGGEWRPSGARAISIDHGLPREPRPPHSEVEDRMDYIVGASMLVTPAFIAKVGRMREDYFLYCEEVEWCLRASAAGERFGYAPDAVVIHAHGTSTGGGGKLRDRSRISIYLVERNRLLVTRDLYPKLFPFAWSASLPRLVLKFAKAGAWKQLGYAVAGWFAALRNERGPPAWFART